MQTPRKTTVRLSVGISDSGCRYAPSSIWIFWTDSYCECGKLIPSKSSGNISSTKLSHKCTGSKNVYNRVRFYMIYKSFDASNKKLILRKLGFVGGNMNGLIMGVS